MAIQSSVSQIQKGQAAAQEQATQKSGSKSLGKDEFLKLLTTQLQFQDPTQPMDSTAFVAQLAQFSTLEQMSNTNDVLTKMLTGQGSSLQTTAASFVGKTAVFATNEVTLSQNKPVSIVADLAQPAGNVTAIIRDHANQTVRTMQFTAVPSGPNTFTWNGLNDSGNALPDDTYSVELTATSIDGKPVALTQKGSAPITGVVFDSTGTPKFMAGGSLLNLSEISELDE
jgi:flagellar basal-body rod modification protein FlgD